MMFKQWLRVRRKAALGLLRTYVWGRHTPVPDSDWNEFWSLSVSDEGSLNPDRDVLTAAHHYATVEALILRHLHNIGWDLTGATVFDVGSGGGHWLDFYARFGADVIGSDVSDRVVEHLRATKPNINVLHGSAEDVLSAHECVDVVHAIGVLFHIVDDRRWRAALSAAGNALAPGGLLIAGGHFGWLPPVNVQFDAQARVNKRLRPLRMWRRALRSAGFGNITVLRNPGYLLIDATQPENHVLIAQRKPT